ncbi:hypothetical protein B0J14DRAFT_609480 [Halenospora varia]|nr:hypothetical protein B0J14DRAFT_609480 [Halenospora varia]
MSTEKFASNNDNDMREQRELHTKYASPRRLSQELKDLLGGSAEFEVEMRHNIYNIKSSKPFNVETLLNKCQERHRMKSARENIQRVSESLF